MVGDDDADTKTEVTITEERRFGECIFVKIRWFVVIRVDRDSCTCLPIHTYGGRGVTKPGLVAEHHAPLVPEGQEEQCLRGESNLLPALHVIVEKGDTISGMARINFRKVYTVEFNVKVCSVGRITRKDIPLLRKYWYDVFINDQRGEISCLYLSHYACWINRSNSYNLRERW